VLRACFRVLKPGGRIAYYTIFVPPDLDAAEHRRAAKFWPSATTRGRRPSDMLGAAGFSEVEEQDVTSEFEATARAWVDGRRRYYEGLKEAVGEARLNDQIVDGEEMVRGPAEGLLRRSFLTAKRPAKRSP